MKYLTTKYLRLVLIGFAFILSISFAQSQNVVISDDSTYIASSYRALLELHSKDNNKGILIPRITTVQRNAISTNTNNDIGLWVYDLTTASFWQFTTSGWKELANSFNLKDNDDNTKILVEETPDDDKIRIKTSGNEYMIIDKNGRVGIGGNNAPAHALHIGKEDYTGTSLRLAGNGSGSDEGGEIRFYTASDYDNTVNYSYLKAHKDNLIIGHKSNITLYNNNALSLGYSYHDKSYCETVFGYRNSNYSIKDMNGWNTNDRLFVVANNTTGNAFTLLKNGNLGIGTATPYQDLSIYGDGNGSMKLRNSNGQWAGIWSSSSEMNIKSSDKISFALSSVGNSKLIINSAGFGIGVNPRATLHIGGKVRQTNTGKSVFIGDNAGISDDTTNNYNVFIGNYAGENNTSGHNNVAIGVSSSFYNYTGSQNTSFGNSAGFGTSYSNIVNMNNTAFGNNSLGYSDKHGSYNTCFGDFTGINITTGEYNTLLNHNNTSITSENYITINLNDVVGLNKSCYFSYRPDNTPKTTALGSHSLYNNTTGTYNVGAGDYSLYSNETGSYNTALGSEAMNSTTNLSNALSIGEDSEPANSNYVDIGDGNITSIGGYVSWSTVSDQRVKENIKENVPGLKFIMKLRPVTYNMDKAKIAEIRGIEKDSLEIDSDKILDTGSDIEKIKFSGFLAQEVEEAANSINYNFSGVTAPSGGVKHYSLSYSQFVMPLVKAQQQQQSNIENQGKMITSISQDLSDTEVRINNLEALLETDK